MSTVNAYYVKSTIEGVKRALLTLKWVEMNAYIAECIQFNSEVTLEVKQYLTTEVQFKEDLQMLMTKGTVLGER